VIPSGMASPEKRSRLKEEGKAGQHAVVIDVWGGRSPWERRRVQELAKGPDDIANRRTERGGGGVIGGGGVGGGGWGGGGGGGV